MTTLGDLHPHLLADPRFAHVAAMEAPGHHVPPAPPLVPLADSLADARAIRSCPHRGPAGCGCQGLASCSRPDRPAEVSRPECVACVRAAWWEAKPT